MAPMPPASRSIEALLSDDVYEFVKANAKELDQAIDYKRDFGYDYFGFKTLEKSYLLRVHGKSVERPQHLIMRASCGIHCGDLAATLETYDLMSRKFFTHATPTLFNSGTPKPQMSSCFLLKMQDDSIEGVYDTLKQCALISKSAGGIGVAISNIRASGSYIRGTNGHSNGLVPMLRNFNETARYVDQGGGKRKGSFAMYLEPWHADVYDFIELRKNHGKEEQRARDLLYTKLEAAGKGRKTIKAQHLWFRILEAQMETGTPYMLYKAGAMKGNLASLALSAFVNGDVFDFQKLYEVTKVVTKNLNKDEARRLNEDIFETIYFAACEASMELAAVHGPYETYAGSPASKGKLQFDLNRKPRSGRWDWQALKDKIAQHGFCNSLLVAPMPTASTAQILGNNESFEPYTQNLYVRRVLSGEFVNRHLLKDLISRGLWSDEMRVKLIAHNGTMRVAPARYRWKDLYKTVWEIKQRRVLDLAADRGAYIDQSQSLNIHMVNATTAKLSSMHFHGWEQGLKTGLYYLRTKAAADAIKFTVDVDALKRLGTALTCVWTSSKAESTGSLEKSVIQSLKAEGPKYHCENCSS
eukprot:Skav212420  [mRNA]  locus=scaffold202:79817:93145:+ [translate_table: standard]